MKLTIVLIIATILQVSASSFAQKITLSEKDAPLVKVFRQIRNQTGYDFLVTAPLLQKSRPVNLSVKDADLNEVLKKLFSDQPLKYAIQDKSVIVSEKDAPSFLEGLADRWANIDIRGVVLDENGNPLVGAVVKVKETSQGTSTNEKGEFYIPDVDEKSTIIIAFVGYELREMKPKKDMGTIKMVVANNKLEEVNVSVNTGYQQIAKERVTGSFVQLDNELLNRRVGTNVIDRLDGITSGLLFVGTKSSSALKVGSVGINIRGESTLSSGVSRDPLIVLDNFPYEGTIDNINPNDIENVTVLKDAAAASIWGARSGNGVIVITTKKGRFNKKPVIDFAANITVGKKPNLFYDRKFLKSSDYIAIEEFLYKQGYYNDYISNTYDFPALSPVIDILSSNLTQRQKDDQINALRNIDVRKDFDKYVYQKALNQQYSIGLRGGSENLAYSLSVGYDKNRDNLIRNGFNRVTINSQNTYKPTKNLEITAGIIYSDSKALLNNQMAMGQVGVNTLLYSQLLPYTTLADGQGKPLAITHDYRSAYTDSTASLGFLDWKFRPLDEINIADNNMKTTDLLAKIIARYQFGKHISAEVFYQNETQKSVTRNFYSDQSYASRNLVNGFAQYDPVSKSFTYPFPKGAILNIGNYNRTANSGRVQLNYDQVFAVKHSITAIAGAEIREVRAENYMRTSYGYDDQYGTSASVINYTQFMPINPGRYGRIDPPPGFINGSVNRFISYYANAGYTYDQKYTLTLSGRKDGANIFGVKTNDKITPLWSAGFGWTINNEDFYQLSWLPYLKLRASYGFNGNVYNGSAYVTGRFAVSPLTDLQVINDILAPNPRLRWEKVKNINVGIDFGSIGSRISGSLELYRKDGLDLINQIPLAPTTGFISFNGNSAHTSTKGFDLQITRRNLTDKFKWSSTLLLSHLKDKVVSYNVTQTANSIQEGNGIALVGKPLYGLFSYKWAGLDPANGDPQGYLNGEVSKDYTGIINNYSPDSLVFNGSARPTVYGSIRNDFGFGAWSLSLNIIVKSGYYFRRPSTSLNYTSVISYNSYGDAVNRWQKPGDEKTTSVPSFVYPSDENRNNFYQYSEVLVEKADHIRLQDIRVGYDFNPMGMLKRSGISRLQVYGYVNNVGILWRANKYKIDPDVVGSNAGYVYPNPTTFSIGVNLGL